MVEDPSLKVLRRANKRNEKSLNYRYHVVDISPYYEGRVHENIVKRKNILDADAVPHGGRIWSYIDDSLFIPL